jgi:uncharacterized protein (TIGR03083 family)
MTSFGRSFADACDALERECRSSYDAVRDLSPGGFERPTRCTDWNVRVLLAHLWRDVDVICGALSDAEPPKATVDAASYFKSYDPRTGSAAVSRRAFEAAGRFATPRALVESFDERIGTCVAAARAAGAARLVAVRIGSLALEEYVGTRVIEAVVHGLDLARALDHEPWITPTGAEITVAILVRLLGEGTSAADIDDVAFIEAATGRAELSEADRRRLGSAADRFPLFA